MDNIKFANQYKSSDKPYPFPQEDIDQSLKSKPDYFRASVNAILGKYFMNRCSVPYDSWGDRRPYWELRAYRTGKNSPNKYKNLLIGLDKTGNRLPTSINISWDILQILPQKIDVVKGYLQKINYDVDIQAIDYQSLLDKKTMVSMAKVLADPRIEEMKAQMQEAAGRPVLQDTDPSQAHGGTVFSSPEQVDVASQVGIFFLEEEAALQNLLDKTQYESGSDGIADLVKEDLITLGHAGKRVYTNPNTNIVMEDYVDVDRAIFPWSQYTDYRDITYAGEVKRYSIARLLQETDITEEQAIKIARQYSSNNGVIGNTPGFYADISQYRQTGQFGMNMWHQIEVDVADCKWFGKKNVNVTSVTREKERTLSVNLVDDSYDLSKVKNNKGKQLDRYSHMTVYKAKMVVGTDYVFDYGEDNDIIYNRDINNNITPVLPYKFVRTGSSSLVERCIGFVDDACLTNYKLRVARMKMPAPPNVQIDRSALEGMQIDGVKYKPQQLIKLLSDEGFLITDSKNQWGQNQNQGRAVTPIGTDLMQVIAGWWEDMGKSIEMIEKVTGINDVFAAQSPQRQTGLGVSNLLIQGAQNALTPIIKANEYLTEQPWRVAAKKWQIVATYLPDEQKKKLSINRSLQIVKIGSEMPNREFDLKLVANDNSEEIQQLLADLQNMKSAARAGGQQGLSESDYLVIYDMLRSGKLKQAQLYTAFAFEKRQQQAQQEAQQAIESNGQQQQQSAQLKGQIDAQNIQVKGQVDGQNSAQLESIKSRNDIQLEIVKGQQQQAAIRLQAALAPPKQQSA
jgi:hypothetical protein